MSFKYYSKYSLEEVKEKIYKVHNDLVLIDENTYINVSTKARFIDKDYGEWWVAPNIVISGARHKQRFLVERRLNVNDYIERLAIVHNNKVQIVKSTYIGFAKKAKFIDCDYGEWWAKTDNVINGATHPKRGLKKRKSTWIKKYGVDNPFKSDVVQEKVLKTIRKNVSRIHHWNTGKELICVGSYEKAFVNWCNFNCYDFDWQITHKLPWGGKYRIDAYVKNGPLKDKWVEIKGWWRDEDSRKKWVWFSNENKNSLLLMRPQLKELGIL